MQCVACTKEMGKQKKPVRDLREVYRMLIEAPCLVKFKLVCLALSCHIEQFDLSLVAA